MDKSQHDRVRDVSDELEIIRLTSRLARAQDDRDFAGYRSCLADTVMIDQQVIPGWKPTTMGADEWTANAMRTLGGFDVTHHRLSGHLIVLDGDQASCEVDVNGLHFIGEGEDLKSWTAGGRYTLRLRRGECGWRIHERTFRLRYQTGDLTLLSKATERGLARETGSPRADFSGTASS